MTYWAVTPEGQAFVVKCEYDVQPYPIYGIGEPYAIAYVAGTDFGRTISPERLNRVAKAAELRRIAYQENMHACTTPTYNREVDYEVEYADEAIFRCNHFPHEHGPNGCKVVLEWEDDGAIYCDCEVYQKPAPLVCLT